MVLPRPYAPDEFELRRKLGMHVRTYTSENYIVFIRAIRDTCRIHKRQGTIM